LAVRWFALAVMGVGRLGERLSTFVRSRALFPNNPDVICHWTAEVKCSENVTLGKNVIIGRDCVIGASAPIYLGDDVLLSAGTMVETGTADISTPVPYARLSKPIRIERGVWLGARSIVLAGVTIGENSIVAAGAIVRKSVPANSFVTGERVRTQAFAANDTFAAATKDALEG
jgi:maltose O-acetyltransferase